MEGPAHASQQLQHLRTGRRRPHQEIPASPSIHERYPCPATGETRGASPGYVIGHVKQPKRGGADEPANMQWQTTAAAKAKDESSRAGAKRPDSPGRTTKISKRRQASTAGNACQLRSLHRFWRAPPPGLRQQGRLLFLVARLKRRMRGSAKLPTTGTYGQRRDSLRRPACLPSS